MCLSRGKVLNSAKQRHNRASSRRYNSTIYTMLFILSQYNFLAILLFNKIMYKINIW